MKNYIDYTVEDFVLDPGFQRWVLRHDEAQKLYWELWISKHPDKLEIIKYAKRILISMKFTEESISYKEIESQWQLISDYFDQYYPHHNRISLFLYTIFHKIIYGLYLMWQKISRLYHTIIIVIRHIKYKKSLFKKPKKRKSVSRNKFSYIVFFNEGSHVSFLNHITFNLIHTRWRQGNTFLSFRNGTQTSVNRMVIKTPGIQMTIMDARLKLQKLNNNKFCVLKGAKIILQISNNEEPILMVPHRNTQNNERDKPFRQQIDPNNYLFMD